MLKLHCFDLLLRSPGTAAKHCDENVRLFVCFFVCLSARISQKPHRRTSPNFLCMLPVTVAVSSSDGCAICNVLPVLWMMCHVFTQWVGSVARCVRVHSCAAKVQQPKLHRFQPNFDQWLHIVGCAPRGKSAIYGYLAVDLMSNPTSWSRKNANPTPTEPHQPSHATELCAHLSRPCYPRRRWRRHG